MKKIDTYKKIELDLEYKFLLNFIWFLIEFSIYLFEKFLSGKFKFFKGKWWPGVIQHDILMSNIMKFRHLFKF